MAFCLFSCRPCCLEAGSPLRSIPIVVLDSKPSPKPSNSSSASSNLLSDSAAHDMVVSKMCRMVELLMLEFSVNSGSSIRYIARTNLLNGVFRLASNRFPVSKDTQSRLRAEKFYVSKHTRQHVFIYLFMSSLALAFVRPCVRVRTAEPTIYAET